MTTKTYSRRDSATAALRRLGIDKSHYNDFIEKFGNTFICRLDAAKASLLKPKKVINRKSTKVPRVTISSRTRGLILEGLSNEEVWAKIQPEFDMSDDKNYYPAWYRCEQRRKGHLAPQHYFDPSDPVIRMED